jgi:hypothetical protein
VGTPKLGCCYSRSLQGGEQLVRRKRMLAAKVNEQFGIKNDRITHLCGKAVR